MSREMLLGAGLVVIPVFVAVGLYVVMAYPTPNSITPYAAKWIDPATWDEGRVKAVGTWKALDGQVTYPIQTSEVRCDRDAGSCFEATAWISKAANSLELSIGSKKIIHWSKDEIIYQDDGPCVTTTYTMTRRSWQVTARQVTKQPMDFGCRGIRQNELHLALTDGLDVWQEEQNKVTFWERIGFRRY